MKLKRFLLVSILAAALVGPAYAGNSAWEGSANTVTWKESGTEVYYDTGDVRIEGGLFKLKERVAPAGALAGYGRLYVKSSDHILYFMDATGVEYDLTSGGGGGGAPLNCSYITAVAEGGLPNERTMTAGAGITVTDGGAGTTLTVSIGNDQIKDTMIDWGTGAGQVSTDDVTEGSTNKFFTYANANTWFATKTTTDLAEGVNKYYTEAYFNTSFSGKDTDDLAEGATNKYFSNTLARAAVSAAAPVSYNGVTGQFGLYYDNTSIGLSASNLEVKDSGITEPKLAMADSPLTNEFIRWNGTAMEWASVSTYIQLSDLSKTISQAAHGFSVGEVLRWDSGTSTYVRAQANSEANAQVVGIVDVIDTDEFIMLIYGYAEVYSGLTPGATYYLSDSVAGALTTTPPTAAGSVVKPVLVATTAANAYFPNWLGIDTTPSLTGLTLGVDVAGGSPNLAGYVKLWSAGDNAYYTKLTAGTQTGTAEYTLPTALPSGAAFLKSSAVGVMSWDESVYLTAEVDGSVTNELQNLWLTISSQSGSTTASSQTDTLTINGAGIATTAIVGDTLTITAIEVDGSVTNELQNLWATIASQSGSTTANSQTDTLTINGGGIATTAVSGDTLTVTATEADTLATVTGRGNSTTTDILVGSTNAFYFGASDVDGTWRIVRSGNNLVFERRESGSYVTKFTMTP